MATVETRTFSPMTMMPDVSSMTHPGRQVGLDAQLLDVGDQVDDAAVVGVGHLDVHGAGIARPRRRLAAGRR